MPVRPIALLLLAAVLAAAGCGPTRPTMVYVSGKVTLDGQPLEGADVSLMPESGKPAVGKTNAAGEFTLRAWDDTDGVLPGKYRAVVSKSRVTNVGITPEGLSAPALPGGPKIVWDTPAKYAKPETSGFSATVEPGMAPLLFELKTME